MSYKLILLKRVRESIRNTKSPKEFELLRDNLPYGGVFKREYGLIEYLAYVGLLDEVIISKEEYDIYREIFDLINLKFIRTTGGIDPRIEFNITYLEEDVDEF